MLPTRWILPATWLAGVSLAVASCNKGGAPSEPDRVTTASANPKASLAAGPAAPPPPGGSADARAVLADIPGMDFSTLPPAAQQELASVLRDDFCFCGCPHSLGACLKGHPTCRHARRMAQMAALAAQAGVPGVEISNNLSRYYESFKEPRRAVKVDERMCRGNKDAKVTLVEYSDFECPYCGAARPMLEQLVKTHGAKVRLCYAPFPLQQHPNALVAGQAALLARDAGKFWEMHDLLFENQTILSPTLIKQLAAKIGLSQTELAKVTETNRYIDELNAWKESGKAAGLESTPSLYFNGRRYNLALTPELLAQRVDDELEWLSNQGSWAAD